MESLPVRKVNGVGRVFERELEAVGIKTCGDIFEYRGILRQLFGEKAFEFLLNMYLGLGRTKIRPAEEYERKSVGTESTFRDLSGGDKLREKLKQTAEELERDLKKTNFTGRVLVLKVKLHTYEVLTRQRNIGRQVCKKDELYSFALPLLQGLETEFPGMKLRLMGLRVTGLVSTRKEVVDMKKWFFGNTGASSLSSPKKRKPQLDDDGWEVWPEEEFERAQEAEKEEEMQLTQELDEELEAKEREQMEEQEAEKEKREVEDLTKREHKAASPESTAETWQCPICGNNQTADDTLFNQHMDFCLSKGAIRSAVQESSSFSKKQKDGPPPRKKRLLFASKRQPA
jgi:DNA polymerase kappa